MKPSSSAAAKTPADAQADALVRDIKAKIDEQCRALRDSASREAKDLLDRARDKARRQRRRAIQEWRSEQRRSLQQTRAELETALRQRASAAATELLHAAWPRLVAAIEQRWLDTAARAGWIDAQITQAQQRCRASGWTVQHPAAWGADEISALQGALRARGRQHDALQADPSLRSGLVIEADGARLDSSRPALLADRARIGAELLAEVAALAKKAQGE